MKHHKLKSVIYFTSGHVIVKGIIDERIEHYTNKEAIVKYIVRPYGMEQFVDVNEKEIYHSLKAIKSHVLTDIKENYTKENIVKNYEEGKKQVEAKYEKGMKDFDENYSNAINMIADLTDEYFEKKEEEYQKSKKEKTNGSI